MAAVPATLVLFLYFTLVSGYTLVGDDDDNEIIWPSEYHFKGENLNFMTNQKETFEIWYSADRNRSRIDVFDGTVKKWYYGDTGYAYQIHPFTDEEVTNQDICISRATEDEQPDFLPSVYGVTYTGQSMTLYDKVVDIWTRRYEYKGIPGRETTLYVFKTDSGIDLPVQQVEKEYNYNTGKLTSHIITNYFDFRDTVSDEELTLDTAQEIECGYQELGKDFHKDIKFFHPNVPSELDHAFHLYTNHHNKLYQDQEHQMRKRIFEKNWRSIDQHNHKNLGYRLELNAFSDKTPEELKYLTGSRVPKRKDPDMMPFPHTLKEIEDLVQELPESFDLRMEGDDTPVKHQGDSCGSCWAFCTNTAIEGALARVNGDRLLDLSEQSLVDCSWGFGTHGCHGGWPTDAMKYVMTHGIPTEMEYGTYEGVDGYCKIQNMTSTYKIRGFSQVTVRNPNALKLTLFKYGPVTVVIHVTYNFIQYSSGLFYDLGCDEDGAERKLGHCVTVVGYGVRDGEEYWIIKNSWGEDWGEDGYILMSARNNNCFVLDSAIYAIV